MDDVQELLYSMDNVHELFCIVDNVPEVSMDALKGVDNRYLNLACFSFKPSMLRFSRPFLFRGRGGWVQTVLPDVAELTTGLAQAVHVARQYPNQCWG